MTNRKRKLQYIRIKNQLRIGNPLFTSFKVSETVDLSHRLVKDHLEKTDKSLGKYKIPNIEHSLNIGVEDGDFHKNLLTVKIESKRKL